MALRHWAWIALGAAIVVAGVLLIVGDHLPGWVPAWDEEWRLVFGLGIALGGFVVAGLGGLAGISGMQSMTARQERGATYVNGWVVSACVALGIAGGLMCWYPPARAWVRALDRLPRTQQTLVGGGALGVAVLGLLLFGKRRVRRSGPPQGDPGPPPGGYVD